MQVKVVLIFTGQVDGTWRSEYIDQIADQLVAELPGMFLFDQEGYDFKAAYVVDSTDITVTVE